ncbi:MULTISPECIES: hypothetical protein [unclassified Archaeoglobus]|jgi:hypothetical protein|uniref:hypothetical protein n=1 Tax=unclassified Archaeoglobus TaxID=2643606 RepID=UPI0025BD76A1|nr:MULTISPECIES: hypothetical protein [unclassified Archaeoglobus]
MSLYSGLVEAVKSIKEAKAVEGVKDVKGMLRKLGHAGGEVRRITIEMGSKVARSKLAKYAAYPVAIGGGIGAGTYLATRGIAEGTKEVGEGIRKGFGFSDVKKATQTLSGVAMLLILLLGGLFVYERLRGKRR